MDDFPANLPRIDIASLPTPVSTHVIERPGGTFDIGVKHDELTSTAYGGNKVRKLEYLLRRAQDRGAERVATYGAVGSNHALATAIHASQVGLACTCFLAHQKKTPKIPYTLNMHRMLGTEIIPWHSEDHVTLYRRFLQRQRTLVIPLGGTSVRGTIGFVNAGFELARQVRAGALAQPARIYIACGTTGSAAGLILGLAAAGLETDVHAIQVADNPFASEAKLRRLITKTESVLSRFDRGFKAPGWQQRLVWRDDFLAGGYARVDDATLAAVDTAQQLLGLTLETTYTGKAFAALLHDLQAPAYDGDLFLYWNTCNAAPLPVAANKPDDLGNIPEEFERYYS